MYKTNDICVAVGQVYCATVRKVVTNLEIIETILDDAPCR